jgi:hypothetical protein
MLEDGQTGFRHSAPDFLLLAFVLSLTHARTLIEPHKGDKQLG